MMKKLLLLLSLAILFPLVGMADTAAFVVVGTAAPDGVTETGTIQNGSSGNIVGETFTIPGVASIKHTQVSTSKANVSSNQARWYKDDTLTLTPEDGVTITKVTFNCGTANYAKAIKDFTVVDKAATWTGEVTAANPLVIANTAQVRFSNIVIEYTKTSGDERTPVALAFGDKPAKLNVGETATVTVTATPAVTPVVLTSSDPSVATVTDAGVVTAVAAGTVTITASYAGDSQYRDAKASFELKVVKPIEGNAFQIVFKTGSSDTSLSTTTKSTTYIEEGVDYVSGVKSATQAYYNSANGLRLASSNNAGSLTLTLAESYKITAITVNAAAYNTSTSDIAHTVNNSKATVNGTALTDYQYTYAPTEATNEISFSVPSKKRVFIKSLTIYFASDEPGKEYVTAPQFTPGSGDVAAGTEVTLSCATEGAVIRYTTDGTMPDAQSAEYTAPIVVNETTVIKAIAMKEGMEDSPVNTATFTVVPAYATLQAWLDAKPATGGIVNVPVTAVYQNGINLYITEGGAFTLVYGDVGQSYVNGDVIPAGINGKYEEFNGLPEFVPVASFVQGTAGTPVQPEVVTALSAEMVNRYVTVDAVDVTAVDGQNVTATVGGEAIAIYNKFNIDIPVAANLTVTGFVNIYTNKQTQQTTVQLYPVEITEHPTKAATPVVEPSFGTVYPGDVITLSCPMADATLSGTFGDEEIAETPFTYTVTEADLDRVISVSVKATVEGLDDSDLLTGEFTVVERPATITSDATFNWTDPSSLVADNAIELPDAGKFTTVKGFTFTGGNISMTLSGEGTASARIYNKSGNYNLRLYKAKTNQANGETVNFGLNSAVGSIEKIEFTYSSDSDGKLSLVSGQPGKLTGDVWTAQTEEAPLTRAAAEPVKSVTFATTSKNVYINSAKVTYTDISTGISSVVVVDGDAVYYNLQGIRVANPAAGEIYIRVRGSQVDKIRF